MSTDVSMQDAIRGILRRVTSLRDCAALPAEADLREAGLTSFDLISLLMEAEETFGVSLPDDAITRAGTASIAAVAATIEGQRVKQASL